VILRHILPNVLSSLVVIATLELARAIVLEATLSFLGLGIQPPDAVVGRHGQEGREYLDSAWWISTFPGLVLMADVARGQPHRRLAARHARSHAAGGIGMSARTREDGDRLSAPHRAVRA
jgi:hypothetical protein